MPHKILCYKINVDIIETKQKVLINGHTSVPRLFYKVLISHRTHYAISEALRAVCGRGLWKICMVTRLKDTQE